MIEWHTIQQRLYQLVDDRQDYWQWGSIALCLIGAIAISMLLTRTVLSPGSKWQVILTRFFAPGKQISGIPLLFCLLLWVTWAVRSNWSASLVAQGYSYLPCSYIYTTTLLVTAIVLYRIATALSQGSFVPRFLGGAMIIVFALHLFGWLDPLRDGLNSIQLPLGSINIKLWEIMSAIAALIFLLWLVSLSTRFLDTFIRTRQDIPPSIKVLIGKTARLVLYTLAIIGALKIGGVPLGGLAIFSGALGLGLGFGLQKVISNLVSGVIILLDKSIKPGDVIEIEGTFGWINTLRTRYISVITRDRKEILIPNEDFVTNKVINWSFTDRTVRIKADVGVAYDTDIPKAIEVCKKAVEEIPRVLNKPEPNCLLMGFGDSSIDLQVRFWINDAPQGVSNVRSEVMLAVWKAFRDNNIDIPFPQRDLHIKTHSDLPLTPPAGDDH